MKLIIQLLSLIGLALTVVPSFFVLGGTLDEETYRLLMLVGTFLWLASAPFWIFKKKAG